MAAEERTDCRPPTTPTPKAFSGSRLLSVIVKARVGDDFSAELTRPSCCRVALRRLSAPLPPPASSSVHSTKVGSLGFDAIRVKSFLFFSL